MTDITDLDALRALYDPVRERSAKKELPQLDAHATRLVGLSPFVVVGSGHASTGAHDIHPGNMRINPARHINAFHYRAVLRVIEDLLSRNLARLEDFLIMVNIIQEHVQRLDPLA